MNTRIEPVWTTIVPLVVAIAAGCRDAPETSEPASPSNQTASEPFKENGTMKLTSPVFDDGQGIPEKFTGAGEDVSPALAWSAAPEETKSFALICDDPDAPSRANPRPEGPWVHWVIYNIPADSTGLPEGVPRQAELADPAGVRQGKNDFPSDNVGYRGPMPPPGSGPHRYYFKLYALNRQLDLAPADATKASLLEAMQGAILEEAELMGTFERK